MTDTLGTLSPEAKAFYDKNLLLRATPHLFFHKFGQKRNIPKNSGNQVSYRRFNSLTTATTALTEGVTPAADSLDMTEITGTVQQYGNYVKVSDSLDLMGIDRVILEATDVLGENGGETVDEIVRETIEAGTTVQYATGSARASQSSSDVLTRDMVRKACRTLKANKAKPHRGDAMENGQGGVMIGIIHPYVFYDLYGDTQFDNTFAYSDPEKMYKGVLPMADGVAWYETTNAPLFSGEGSGGHDVFGTLIIAREAYGVVDVGGTKAAPASGKLTTIVKPLGSAGADDPLNQRASVGWKSWQLPKILNDNFMVRIETGATDQT